MKDGRAMDERVEEIRRALVKSSHPQGWWYMAAHDLLKRLDTLTTALAASELKCQKFRDDFNIVQAALADAQDKLREKK